VVPGPVGTGGATTIEVAAELVCAGEPLSVTVAVKLYVPLVEGVPEMMPVVAARVSPAGRLPEVIDQVYAGVPPVAVMVLEYAVFTVPETRVALIVRVGGAGAATTSERATDLVCAGFPESVTVALKLEVPAAVGVPEIRPVAGARVSPAGRLPTEMDQV
jgi:hypothetical protein